MKDEVLFQTKWLSLRRLHLPDKGVEYDYVHEERCNGGVVAILPFRVETGGYEFDGSVGSVPGSVPDSVLFLLRREIVPPWGLAPSLCAITGGMDQEGRGPAETALAELEEEAGYRVTLPDLVSLGTCRGTKAMDTVVYLFTTNLTGKTPVEPKGDGTPLEDEASTEWVSNPIHSPDPVVSVMCARVSGVVKFALGPTAYLSSRRR